MNQKNLMQDPFFAEVIFCIESAIHDADRAAASTGVILKDSHIRSSLSKAKVLAKGKHPKADAKTEREKLILKLAESIDQLRSELRESAAPDAGFEDAAPIRVSDWLASIKAIEESLKMRTVSGSRHYLDYLASFMAEARSGETQRDSTKRKRWWKR